ncbi:hypothetical protein HYC85_004259 [Camellia sinensis]|uniref:Thioredoxin-like fold domain-containing protein n=1 Tax=Camellia sinensis TaxID=4442 RepID=A0A7J7HY54_CAMSI|nr:hypothetical protein HYC85_004259 [Camellia sinensis]
MDNSTPSPNFPKSPSRVRPFLQAGGFTLNKLIASRIAERLKPDDDGGKKDGEAPSGSDGEDDDPLLMDEEQRQEWSRKIREVIDMNPDVEEEVDPVKRRKKMQKLLADYPLVVEEDDPDWPKDSDGWGFSLGQFFDKITIKNVKKDDDDENYDGENELVAPFPSNFSFQLCVAIDAVVELDLVSALQVSIFPELIFTKAGKILYCEKAIQTADELSKIMAFFYYGAAKLPSLNTFPLRDTGTYEFMPI